MVTIIGFNKRTNKAGEEFNVLELQGEIELLKAVNTGKFYAHARKATITTTLNEIACRTVIGKKFPGEIKKVACEEYSYQVPGTNDIIKLNHSYQYIEENLATEKAVFEGEVK